MREYILLGLSFMALFLSLFWIQVMFLKIKKINKIKYLPKVSVIIPAYNEQNTIAKTIKSILNLDYPKNKLQVIVVNDGSTDNTANVVKKFKNVLLVNNEHKGVGKASALNKALGYVRGEFIGILDADSEVKKDSLKKMINLFQDKKTAAVISAIKVKNPRNLYHYVQRLEYILVTFIRKLMSKIDTLHITPGALSIYRTSIIRKLGGFDENNITEDLEIAMRLRYNNYSVKMNHDSISYTNVPSNFKQLWNQRVRWFRGFIHNNLKYKKMFFNKKYGFIGTFQLPLNALTFFTVVLLFILITYELITRIYEFILKIILLKSNIIYTFDLPSLKELVLSLDMKLIFPLIIAFLLTLFILNLAHKSIKERFLINPALLIYFTVYPILRGVHWMTALFKEVTKTKRKW